jgi:hypothetical protein
MERRITIDIATAFLFTSILLATFAHLGTLCHSQNYSPNSTLSFQHSVLQYVPHFIFSAATSHSLKYSDSDKQVIINHPAKNNAKISIFE